MSHTVTIDVQFKDMEVLEATCNKLNIPYKKHDKVTFYDRSTHSGFAVYFHGWKYPLVVDANSQMHMDTFEGRWGNMEDVQALKMHYGVEKVKKLARQKHYQIKEYTENGKPKLRIYVRN